MVATDWRQTQPAVGDSSAPSEEAVTGTATTKKRKTRRRKRNLLRVFAVAGGVLRLEPVPDLQLQIPQRLRAGRGAEAGISRREPRRIERAVREVLRVDDRLIRRAPEDNVPVPIVVDHHVERVEDIEPELEVATAAETDVPRDREVDGVIGTAAEQETARLEADAAIGRPFHCGRVELLVLIARAARSRIADEEHAGGVVGRAGQIRVRAVALVRVSEI